MLLMPKVMYSAALCRGLIEASISSAKPRSSLQRIPRLYAAASLKLEDRALAHQHPHRIPRLYAAASLKLIFLANGFERQGRIPRLYAAASLKLMNKMDIVLAHWIVFRGFMPRPH